MADSRVGIRQLINLEVKDAERGEVEAVVATLGVVDGDGDVILPGAIRDSASVKVSGYAHDVVLDRRPPVGKGTVTVRGTRVVFKGRMFLSTERGREAFTVLREMGRDQEWSFGFHVLRAKPPDDEWRAKGAERLLASLDAFEVSPVLRGAGIGTRTVSVKSKAALEPIAAEFDAEFRRFQATVARVKAIEARLEGSGPSRPLPDRFRAFVHWAAARSAIAHAIPEIKLVAGLRLDRRSPGAWGMYYNDGNEVWIRDGLDDESVRKVILHEFAHAYEHTKGWLHDEGFAELSEQKLIARWHRERPERSA